MTQEISSWEYGITTHRGTVREINEDSAILKQAQDLDGNELMLVMIADGMGGYQAGDIASQTITDKVSQWWEDEIHHLLEVEQPFEAIQYQLNHLFAETNDQLIAYGKQEAKRLGTTATVLFLYQGYYLIMHVGDSRIYQIEANHTTSVHHTELIHANDVETAVIQGDKKIRQLTEDHSWVEAQVKKGALTREEAAIHEKRNVLLQCIGIENDIQPFVMTGTYRENDIFLLCSDGFYNLFTNQEILSSILDAGDENLKAISEALVYKANQAGATDNVTVLLSKAFTIPVQSSSWTMRMRRFIKKII